MGFMQWMKRITAEETPGASTPQPPPASSPPPATSPPAPPATLPPAPPATSPPAQPAPPPQHPAQPAAPVPAPATPAAADAGFFGRFARGLARTRDRIVSNLRAALPFGKTLDDQLLSQIERQLIEADLGVDATRALMAALRDAWREGQLHTSDDVLPFLKRKIAAAWPEDDISLKLADAGPTVILIVGVNGSGKTTTVAKLANRYKSAGKSVLVAACDTFRAGAVHQLEIWAERAGVQIVRHTQGADPAAVAYDACDAAISRQVDILLIDTAGRLHTQQHLMRELDKIRRVVQKRIPEAPHESLLVLDATTGQNALQQAKLFSAVTPLTGIVLTKLDGSAKGGVVIAIRNEVNVPVKFVGLGETMDDLAPFDPPSFVAGLFGEKEAA